MATQFYIWIKGIVTEGKFGYSFAYRKDVGILIADRLGKTLILAILAISYPLWSVWVLESSWRPENTVFGIIFGRSWHFYLHRYRVFLWRSLSYI